MQIIARRTFAPVVTDRRIAREAGELIGRTKGNDYIFPALHRRLSYRGLAINLMINFLLRPTTLPWSLRRGFSVIARMSSSARTYNVRRAHHPL